MVKSPGACKIHIQVLGEILEAPMSNEGWMNILLWYFLVGRIVMRLVMSSQTLDFSRGVRCCVADGRQHTGFENEKLKLLIQTNKSDTFIQLEDNTCNYLISQFSKSI